MDLIKAIKSAGRAFRNHYTGAQMASPRRAWVPAYYRDARFDATQFTRYELARKIRDFARNVWLVGRLRSVYSQYSVGPNGLNVVPASSDPKWNEAMKRRYDAWCLSPAIDSALPIGEQHQLMADTTHIDGGVFVHFCNRKTGTKQSVPAVQLIEGHRVATPGHTHGETLAGGKAVESSVDGVSIDGAGRPNGYWIRDGFEGNEYSFRPIYDPAKPWAGGVMHVYDPDRIGQYREITPYASVLNQLQDLDMLATLEMDRAKENAAVAYQMETVDGEMPTASNLLQKRYNTTTPTGAITDPDAELQKRIQQYAQVLGSRVISTKIGEKINQLGSESPSAATQWYWKFLIEQICESVNTPVVLVLPESYQGTTLRGVLDDANAWFTDRFHTFCRPARAMYLHFASWAIYQYPELSDPPADWREVTIAQPRAVNVDKGNSSTSMLAELAAGTTNLSLIGGQRGQTRTELLTERARDIAELKAVCKKVSAEFGEEVTPEEVSAPLAEVVAKMAQAEQAEALAEQAEAGAMKSGKESE